VKRMFWLGLGLATGAYAARRAGAAAQRLTPAGLGASLADGLRELGAGIGEFGAEVRRGMADHERLLAADLQRRTGAQLPTVASALAEPPPTPTPSHRFRDRARAVQR